MQEQAPLPKVQPEIRYSNHPPIRRLLLAGAPNQTRLVQPLSAQTRLRNHRITPAAATSCAPAAAARSSSTLLREPLHRSEHSLFCLHPSPSSASSSKMQLFTLLTHIRRLSTDGMTTHFLAPSVYFQQLSAAVSAASTAVVCSPYRHLVGSSTSQQQTPQARCPFVPRLCLVDLRQWPNCIAATCLSVVSVVSATRDLQIHQEPGTPALISNDTTNTNNTYILPCHNNKKPRSSTH
ncbi:hypothetical protein GQ42DRAFT_81010 [Ramicandelaber brevisporus]|nr:hypothetical protein GQ42DRAFT_81010 [Ramicandelaber brevisporus]